MKDIQITMKSGLVVRVKTKDIVVPCNKTDDVVKVEIVNKKSK